MAAQVGNIEPQELGSQYTAAVGPPHGPKLQDPVSLEEKRTHLIVCKELKMNFM